MDGEDVVVVVAARLLRKTASLRHGAIGLDVLMTVGTLERKHEQGTSWRVNVVEGNVGT